MRNSMLVPVALLAAALAGCTGTSTPDARASVPSTPRPAATSAARTNAPATRMPSLPPVEPGTQVLVQVPARGPGGYSAGPFSVPAGDLELTSFCTGGEVALSVESMVTFPLPCATDSVTPTRNVVTLSRPATVTIRVEAPQGTQWNLLVALLPTGSAPASPPAD